MITGMNAGRESSRDFSWSFSLGAEVSSSYTVRAREFQPTQHYQWRRCELDARSSENRATIEEGRNKVGKRVLIIKRRI
jgi:hypothetical protein